MNEDGALFDSGFDDNEPFRVSPESGSVSLESALRDFGPAAIDDLIPRLRAIATTLDAAHRAGIVHGALHPSKVFVSDTSTYVIAGKGAPFDSAHGKHAYVAPEVRDGHGATPMSDQYGLAAIAYEWLFGRPVTHGGERPIEVRSMPGVDRSALSQAFTRALSPKPEDRFASCVAFCDAMNGAIVPELPLLADVDDFKSEDELGPAPIAAAAVGESPSPFADTPFDAEPDEPLLAPSHPNVDDLKIVAEETNMTAGQPDLDAIDPRMSEPPPVVPAWTAPASHTPVRSTEPQRFGAVALILATLVGAVFGFAAGYMARPRALQTATIATATDASGASGATGATGPPSRAEGAPARSRRSSPDVVRAEADATGASGATGATRGSRATGATTATGAPASRVSPAAAPGRLLVRSTPSGATVTVDGVARGVTPLALRDLSFGTRDVTVARRGYISESVKVAITKARPARTVDVRLSAEAKPASGAAPRPSTPATLGKPAVSTGSLSIESRPAGAAVSLNGKPSGTTPLTINDLAPGEYRIVMSMTGYRNLVTTVRVVAGERARAAASLTALEQE